MGKDYYKILGVSKEADGTAIKKAFRKLAKQFHPDTNVGNPQAEQRFQEINEAYSVLGDEEKRKTYDESRMKQQASSDSATSGKNTTFSKSRNPFTGFTAENFKMDFGDMIFDEIDKKKKNSKKNADINIADVSKQFTGFFGFKP